MTNNIINYNPRKILVFPSVGISYNNDGDACMNETNQNSQYIRENSVINIERFFTTNNVNINDILKMYVVENLDKRCYNNNTNTTVVSHTKEVNE